MASIDNLRLERKFVPKGWGLAALERIILSNPGMFFEVYPPQYVNNVYFDTPLLDLFRQSVDGVSRRRKYRLRWYGRLKPASTHASRWEIKGRENILNHKKVFDLHQIEFQPFCTGALAEQLMRHDQLTAVARSRVRQLRPVLINRYRRRYFLSADRKVRITLDSEVEYFSADLKPVAPLCFDRDSRVVGAIVEMKYLPPHEADASRISGEFPFRLTKNSKYTNGIELLKRCGFL